MPLPEPSISDIQNRTNLEYLDRRVTELSVGVVPAGGTVGWPTGAVPNGFLAANGAAVSRTTYARLFALYGTTFGVGDGSTTFNLPTTANTIIKT